MSGTADASFVSYANIMFAYGTFFIESEAEEIHTEDLDRLQGTSTDTRFIAEEKK